MPPSENYELVRLRNGAVSVRSVEFGETMHPGLRPGAEAEALYVEQLKLASRLAAHRGEFVIWDVGLGAAANALAVLRATREVSCRLRMISFDQSLEPLRFALSRAAELGYFKGHEVSVTELIEARRVVIEHAGQTVDWRVHVGDFPRLLKDSSAVTVARPHAILFDPFSPARNPAMWTLEVFNDLFTLLDPGRPCAVATYSRSTMLRVTLLLAGFYVGRGRATGRKEETTVAANTLALLDQPLGRAWLERAQRSGSAEPLESAVYRQARLSRETWERLQAHSQFA